MDSIILNNLTVEAVIGTLPQERQQPQKLILNIEMELDLQPAGESDAAAGFGGTAAGVSAAAVPNECSVCAVCDAGAALSAVSSDAPASAGRPAGEV